MITFVSFRYLLEEVAEEPQAINTSKRKLTTADDADDFTPAPKSKVAKVTKAQAPSSKKPAAKELNNEEFGAKVTSTEGECYWVVTPFYNTKDETYLTKGKPYFTVATNG